MNEYEVIKTTEDFEKTIECERLAMVRDQIDFLIKSNLFVDQDLGTKRICAIRTIVSISGEELSLVFPKTVEIGDTVELNESMIEICLRNGKNDIIDHFWKLKELGYWNEETEDVYYTDKNGNKLLDDFVYDEEEREIPNKDIVRRVINTKKERFYFDKLYRRI